MKPHLWSFKLRQESLKDAGKYRTIKTALLSWGHAPSALIWGRLWACQPIRGLDVSVLDMAKAWARSWTSVRGTTVWMVARGKDRQRKRETIKKWLKQQRRPEDRRKQHHRERDRLKTIKGERLRFNPSCCRWNVVDCGSCGGDALQRIQVGWMDVDDNGSADSTSASVTATLAATRRRS